MLFSILVYYTSHIDDDRIFCYINRFYVYQTTIVLHHHTNDNGVFFEINLWQFIVPCKRFL